MNKEYTKICPTCLGAGKIISQSTYKPEIREKARKLRREGKTYREIAKILNIDHPQKVYSMIKSRLV